MERMLERFIFITLAFFLSNGGVPVSTGRYDTGSGPRASSHVALKPRPQEKLTCS